MTELLDRAIARVRVLDAPEQDRIAEAMLSLAGMDDPEEIDPRHLPDVSASLAEADRGEFATEEEVAELFRRAKK